jgi:hypothetical protein
MRVICKIKQTMPANGRPMVQKVSLRQEEGDQQAHRNPFLQGARGGPSEQMIARMPGSGDGSRDSIGSQQRRFYGGWVTVLNL